MRKMMIKIISIIIIIIINYEYSGSVLNDHQSATKIDQFWLMIFADVIVCILHLEVHSYSTLRIFFS